MNDHLLAAARNAIGFMPEEEGLALYKAGLRGATRGPLLEIGSYCGKSTLYLGAAALESESLLYSIDHHRGSEEHQPGEVYHDPRTIDATGRIDTLPVFRKTIAEAGLEDFVVAIVARSETVAQNWSLELGLVFIDGGHSHVAAQRDYELWSPHVAVNGVLAIHDVFPDPAEGGRPPYLIFERALRSGAFEEISSNGSLRVLERVGNRI